MSKFYEIYYTKELKMSAVIEADNEEEARGKFEEGDYDEENTFEIDNLGDTFIKIKEVNDE